MNLKINVVTWWKNNKKSLLCVRHNTWRSPTCEACTATWRTATHINLKRNNLLLKKKQRFKLSSGILSLREWTAHGWTLVSTLKWTRTARRRLFYSEALSTKCSKEIHVFTNSYDPWPKHLSLFQSVTLWLSSSVVFVCFFGSIK